MSEEKKREYVVPFRGCRPLNKRQANIIGFTLICGFLATAIVMPTLGKTILSSGFVLSVTIIGYLLGKKLFEVNWAISGLNTSCFRTVARVYLDYDCQILSTTNPAWSVAA